MRQPNNSEALNSLFNPVDILWMIFGGVEESNCVGRLHRKKLSGTNFKFDFVSWEGGGKTKR